MLLQVWALTLEMPYVYISLYVSLYISLCISLYIIDLDNGVGVLIVLRFYWKVIYPVVALHSKQHCKTFQAEACLQIH